MLKPAAFSFYLASRRQPVAPGDARWRRPLPLHRTAFAAAGQRTPPTASTTGGHPRGLPLHPPTRGDLFRAVQAFFQSDAGQRALSRGIAAELGAGAAGERIDGLDVFLVKHGQFYHPCRIEVRIGSRSVALVLNIAISESGLAQLPTEYGALERLNRELPFHFFPRVYGRGEVQSPLPAAMFLGQWLEGFREFHACRPDRGGGAAVVMWDPDRGDRTLRGPQAAEIYRRAAAILAACYNPETFAQVRSWHHAAGDFVVRPGEGAVAVRLISVRSYGPLFAPPAGSGSQDIRLILEALLVFLLQLSIRMRIDRQEGVGDLLWLHDDLVPATVQGFFEGLAAGCRVRNMPDEAAHGFAAYLGAVPESDLLELARQLAAVGLAGEEGALAAAHLQRHCRLLHAALRGA